jgi:hypothetical protein
VMKTSNQPFTEVRSYGKCEPLQPNSLHNINDRGRNGDATPRPDKN